MLVEWILRTLDPSFESENSRVRMSELSFGESFSEVHFWLGLITLINEISFRMMFRTTPSNEPMNGLSSEEYLHPRLHWLSSPASASIITLSLWRLACGGRLWLFFSFVHDLNWPICRKSQLRRDHQGRNAGSSRRAVWCKFGAVIGRVSKYHMLNRGKTAGNGCPERPLGWSRFHSLFRCRRGVGLTVRKRSADEAEARNDVKNFTNWVSHGLGLTFSWINKTHIGS